MRVREFGPTDAPVVVLLHGGNVAGWMWGPQLEAFPGHRLLVPDLPGFGESNDEHWVSIATTADAVAAMLGERGITEADVVGLSLGASVGIELAVRHPELVRRLVLASPTVVPATRRQRIAARVQLAFWHQPAYWSATARAWGLPEEDRELFVRTGLGIRRETAERIVREVVAGRLAGAAGADRRPDPGDRGGAGRAHSVARLDRADPRAGARRPGADHRGRSPRGQPRGAEEFNAAVRDWIS